MVAQITQIRCINILHKRFKGERVYIRQIREIKSVHPGQYTSDPEKAACTVTVSVQRHKESTMLMRKGKLWILVVIGVLAVTGTILGNADAQKASVPKPQNKLLIGEDGIKQLLPLMDTDRNGMVSKQEFMKFMEAEFERLDKNKKGELNVKELTQSNLTASRFTGK
jgi:hypothetical protein